MIAVYLPSKDSNLDELYQKQLCYHYTTRHFVFTKELLINSSDRQ